MIDIKAEHAHDSGNSEHPLVVAYYTMGTPYEAEAETLKLSLESVGYSYLVCGVPNLGSWQKNTQHKALFIQEMLARFPGQPLLYLDVDAVMVQAPVLLDTLRGDIGAVHFANRGLGTLGTELLSGTLWLSGTAKCKEVVNEWIRINEQYPVTLPNGKAAWDQRTLEMSIKKTKGVSFIELPQNFTFIIELTQKRCPGLSPVIMHTRGAKRFKNKIDGKKGYAK